ncbi:DUF3558 domain-containing protein [Haloechinothrix alba]|nr:DUF3558 domain-containing protein [Haloechinothrix alba]
MAFGALTALLVTGCGDSTVGEPNPTDNDNPDTSTTNEPDSDLPHSGAPAVKDPITDLRAFERDPCSVHPDNELAAAGFPVDTSEEELDASAGAVCSYILEGVRAGTFTVTLAQGERGGISHVYSVHQDDLIELFEEADDIHGHPVVIAAEHDRRDKGECGIYTGLRDDAGLDVQVTFSNEERSEHHDAPCDAAYQLAELGIETLRGDT